MAWDTEREHVVRRLDEHHERIEKLDERVDRHDVKLAEIKTTIRLWAGIVGPLAGALSALLVQRVFG